MSQHWVPNRDYRRRAPAGEVVVRGSGAQFQSAFDALRRAVPVWYCLNCNRKYDRKGVCGGCGYKPTYFPSTGEFRAFQVRRMLELAGDIEELRPHPKFPVKINGLLVLTYTADWQYRRRGELIVEEFKGSARHAARDSTLRRKCAQAYYGIEIKVVEK